MGRERGSEALGEQETDLGLQGNEVKGDVGTGRRLRAVQWIFMEWEWEGHVASSLKL